MRPVPFSPRGGFSYYPTRRAGMRIILGMADRNNWIRLAARYQLKQSLRGRLNGLGVHATLVRIGTLARRDQWIWVGILSNHERARART